jgi:hypothetical protein
MERLSKYATIQVHVDIGVGNCQPLQTTDHALSRTIRRLQGTRTSVEQTVHPAVEAFERGDWEALTSWTKTTLQAANYRQDLTERETAVTLVASFLAAVPLNTLVTVDTALQLELVKLFTLQLLDEVENIRTIVSNALDPAQLTPSIALDRMLTLFTSNKETRDAYVEYWIQQMDNVDDAMADYEVNRGSLFETEAPNPYFEEVELCRLVVRRVLPGVTRPWQALQHNMDRIAVYVDQLESSLLLMTTPRIYACMHNTLRTLEALGGTPNAQLLALL